MALKLIHTADWHLGQTFFGYDREAEHEAFLGFLTNLLVERQTDVLLIAGDVFDVTNPSAGGATPFLSFPAGGESPESGLADRDHRRQPRFRDPSGSPESLAGGIEYLDCRYRGEDGFRGDRPRFARRPFEEPGGRTGGALPGGAFPPPRGLPGGTRGRARLVCGGYWPDVPAALRLCGCPEESRRGDRSLGTPPRYRSRTIGG